MAISRPHYRDEEDFAPSAAPEMGAGFAEALSSLLAQGGGRKLNPRTTGKGGSRYTQGPIKGMTHGQAIERGKQLWRTSPQSVRDKYSAGSAMLGDGGMSRPMAGGVALPDGRTYDPGQGIRLQGGVHQPVAMPQYEPPRPPSPTPPPPATTPVAATPPARAAVSPLTAPSRGQAIAQGAVAQPGLSAPQAPAIQDGGNLAQRMVGNMVGNFAPGVAAPIVAAAQNPPPAAPNTLAGAPTSDSIFFGEQPPGPGWTLVGSKGGQKKWAKGGEITAANASAAAQTTANVAAAAPRPKSPLTPPQPRYQSAGLGAGVMPIDGSRPDPAYAEYAATRKALPDMEPAARKASWQRVKDFDDQANAEAAAFGRFKRLNPMAR